MFWNRIAGLYDLFENIYNRKVYREMGKKTASFVGCGDQVLECACGTGAISVFLAEKCFQLTAADYSSGMLKQAAKKLSGYKNVKLEQADITRLPYADASFDKVVAGNVIHLLEDPKAALDELSRVVKPGGKLLIPTYVNKAQSTNRLAAAFLQLLGADFKRQFDHESYQAFFKELGYEDVSYYMIEGRMACDLAVITLKQEDRA